MAQRGNVTYRLRYLRVHQGLQERVLLFFNRVFVERMKVSQRMQGLGSRRRQGYGHNEPLDEIQIIFSERGIKFYSGETPVQRQFYLSNLKLRPQCFDKQQYLYLGTYMTNIPTKMYYTYVSGNPSREPVREEQCKLLLAHLPPSSSVSPSHQTKHSCLKFSPADEE